MKRRLQFGLGFEDEYYVVEIMTAMEDYKLSFRLNKELNTSFSRKKDFEVYDDSGNEPIKYSLAMFSPDPILHYYLVRPTLSNVLMPTFCLLIQGPLPPEAVSQFADKISTIEEIISVSVIDFSQPEKGKISRKHKQQLKNFNCIIESLEYHLIELNKKK